MMVFLGILDFSNGEGGSSIDGWWEYGKNQGVRTGKCWDMV